MADDAGEAVPPPVEEGGAVGGAEAPAAEAPEAGGEAAAEAPAAAQEETPPQAAGEGEQAGGEAAPAEAPAAEDPPPEGGAAPAEAAADGGEAPPEDGAAAAPGDAPPPAEAASGEGGAAGGEGAAVAAEAEVVAGFKLPKIEDAFDAWLAAQLEASPADEKDTDEFKYITFTELPPFTDAHKSLMRQVLTPELFEKLKGVKSSKGYTLSNGMQAGVLRPHLGVGFTAGDEECFELFKEVIYPIVEGWHKFDPATQEHKSDLDPAKVTMTEEQAALFQKYVKSTRVRAARNISGYSLPAGSSKEDRLAVEGVLKQAFEGLPAELQGTYYPLGGLTAEQETALQAGGFLFQKPGPMQLLGAAGAGRDWPEGRGIFHNESKTVLCWCNEEDQCRIIAMEDGGDVKGVFGRFCALSDAIKAAAEANGKSLMYDEKLGFLGTCPSNLGTGLRASVMVVLPELNKDPHKLEEICAGFDLQPRGSSGEHSAAVGAKWDISNKQRIGFSEVELVQKMIDGVGKLIAMEEELAAAAAS
uniref:Arginine kinase n=1 Tax=Hemiselmis tepida TaxID=464990 RepID=A0A7S0YWG5_9CRYP